MTIEGGGRCTSPNIAELLSVYADGSLDPGAAAKVETHVTGCPSCAAELVSLRSLLGELRGLPPGPSRTDASWSDFSRSVRVSWQRSREEAEAARDRWPWRRLRRLLWPVVAGAGTAVALGTAALLVAPQLGPRLGGSPTTQVGAGAGAAEGSVGTVRPRAPVVPESIRTAPDSESRRIEAAGRLGDDLDELDPDDLLDGLDDHQLEQVGKALPPGV